MTDVSSNYQPSDDRAEHRRSLLLRPRESFVVELKSWFDPREPQGLAKIVRTTFALRNQNGGFLVIGVDNKTLQPLPMPTGFPSVRELFHPDLIQQTISKYASQSFELAVDFENLGGVDYPIVSVPGGIATPIACRADLKGADGQFLLRENEVYVRTLESNGSISSARISWRDWPALIERCFDNREADHVRFVSKLLPNLAPEFAAALQTIAQKRPTTASDMESEEKFLEYSITRFTEVVKERQIDVSQFGLWDVVLQIRPPPKGHATNRKFLETLRNANPDLTGWPVWLDSTSFHEQTDHPYVFNDAWEAFIYATRREGIFGHWGHLDFWILDPAGKFFLRRVLQDDLGGQHATTAGKTVDPVIAVLRTAEAIAVGQQFARALDCPDDSTNLDFTFKWSRLRGRQLEAWSSPMRWFNAGGSAKQESATASIVFPLAGTRETIIARTYEAISPLMRVFDGCELNEAVVRELVDKLLDRRL